MSGVTSFHNLSVVCLELGSIVCNNLAERGIHWRGPSPSLSVLTAVLAHILRVEMKLENARGISVKKYRVYILR
jgi:hypothetical protein